MTRYKTCPQCGAKQNQNNRSCWDSACDYKFKIEYPKKRLVILKDDTFYKKMFGKIN